MVMVKMKRLFRKGFLSSVLTASLILGGVPLNGFLTPVFADTEKTITGLGTGTIGNPAVPETKDSPWTGSYVWYGKYGEGNGQPEPVKYRVLDKAATKYGGNTLFLDCDTLLFTETFDYDSNVWADSDVRYYLNGNKFLSKAGCLSEIEKASIAESTIEGHELIGGPEAGRVLGRTKYFFVNYIALNEKVFFLDAEDASNTSYGYANYDQRCDNRIKKTGEDTPYTWWLRSAANDNQAGYVDYSGNWGKNQVSITRGVSPAFNVDLGSIIFASLIPGTTNEYKLTLSDNKMSIKVTDGKAVTRKGNKVTVPYTTTGTNAGSATQVSVLITDDLYEWGKAVKTGYAYRKLTGGVSGTGSFELPEPYDEESCGTDYHAYILAEDVNGEKETDYASVPYEIQIPGHTHTLTHYERKEATETEDGNKEYWECSECGKRFTDEAGTHKISREDTVIPKLKDISATVTGFSGTYDGEAHGITVKVTDPSGGAAVRYGTVAGTYDRNASPEYTEVGNYTVYYEVTADGYKPLTGQAIVEIKKADTPGPEHTYAVNVENGDGDGYYAAGAIVNIKADPPTAGMIFDRWTGDGVTFTDAASSETTFIMPAKDVEVTATYKDKEQEDKPDPGKTKVPVTDPSSSYASPEDNFAPVAPGSSEGTGGNIKKLELDFSNVKGSGVAPDGLKMTAITGSKFTTKAKVKDKDSVQTDDGIKAKFNKKDGTVTITCKKTGTATFNMEDGDSYKVKFVVEKPKPNKNEAKISAGTAPVTKTIKDLFGTSITGGKLTILKEKTSGQAVVKDNELTVNPADKDTIKLQYQYLNKKYKMTMKVK